MAVGIAQHRGGDTAPVGALRFGSAYSFRVDLVTTRGRANGGWQWDEDEERPLTAAAPGVWTRVSVTRSEFIQTWRQAEPEVRAMLAAPSSPAGRRPKS
jgi:hypothetical protein